jgi:transitional endoplasmic reticulum ATPase
MTGEYGSRPAGGAGFRRPVGHFERAGWHLTIVDPAWLIAAADPGPVDVTIDPPLPRPVRDLRMSLSAEAGRVQVDAILHYGGSLPRRPYFSALGNGPIGTLLKRGVDAGDERAVRVVAGMQSAADRLNRLAPARAPGLDPRKPAGHGVRTERILDAQTGLETTATFFAAPATRSRTRVVRLSAHGPTLAPADLAGFFAAVVHVLRLVSGVDVTGRFTMSAERSRPDVVSLDQVGGLEDVVAQFRDVAVSFRHPLAMARWGARRPQGILLYGPPGTGKTMLARALAAEIGATLREIRTPEILDKWLGGSERNLKRIFAQARQYRTPTVMLFDEFDSIIGYAGAGDDSGSHAINAVAGLFKQEMNNLIEDNPHVIVVATTNFADSIDASLIRSGRFDIKLEIPRPDRRGRADILARMMRDLTASLERDGFRLFADDVDLDALAGMTDGMVGADLREILRRAQLAKAMHQARTGRSSGPIRQADLLAIVREVGTRPDPGPRRSDPGVPSTWAGRSGQGGEDDHVVAVADVSADPGSAAGHEDEPRPVG